ncbi:SDR family NAD(P)-dependent oxidoreductase [Paenibacillus pasadenensis]|uniref:Oxidoreductase, short chain dehydrogenase/reductase family n=1 Tax=Paenibacillus pasadenensis TaxID=217090 RepID=A0A2N5N4M0_9BACL|nr:SDR family oxidoreductase [Paenibacillus pasadenensis]PLT45288.1 Oxidoreductase, short chain dehydrogenase/reductase family [Paenibacillus pasadenensis]
MESRRTETDRTIITGAGSGIGRALAQAYAGKGDEVLLVDRSHEGLEQTLRLIEAAGGKAQVHVADLSRPEAVKELFGRVRESWGAADVLVNNAGISAFKPLWELEVEEWDVVLDTNLRGTFLCSREAAVLMREKGVRGRIVNIASTRAFMSEPDSEAYAASKGGILALTHALALSLAPHGIRVNSVSPGWIETGDTAKLSVRDHEQHPSGRVGRPDDIARACFYLTDPANDFVTGENITVDGGMTRKMIYAE